MYFKLEDILTGMTVRVETIAELDQYIGWLVTELDTNDWSDEAAFFLLYGYEHGCAREGEHPTYFIVELNTVGTAQWNGWVPSWHNGITEVILVGISLDYEQLKAVRMAYIAQMN
jgi:hypothetical protein